MDDMESDTASPNPRKRPAPVDASPSKKPLNLHGTQFMPTPPDTDASSNASPTYTSGIMDRTASPAPSNSTLTSVDVADSSAINASGTATTATSATPGSAARPAKRRKLTTAEKEQQQRDKAAKDAEKAALKAKREEEKAKREEGKRVKDEEKRQKAEEKEAKKKAKEIEEDKKAQAKLAKERTQMRLGVWFQKPATPVKATDNAEAPTSTARRKSLSLEPFDAVADQIRRSQSPCKAGNSATVQPRTPAKPMTSDYQQYFLPFQLQTNCYLAPPHATDDPLQAQAAFDHEIADPSLQEKYDLGLIESYASLEHHFAEHLEPRGGAVTSARHLVDQIQGRLDEPIDLTIDDEPANPMAALQGLTQRYIEFDVDVRPAYCGTYTKIRSPRTISKMRRNPFTRARKDTDYDYDSEAEWEPPEEGDDECNEDEDDIDSQAEAGEMDEFLDDEDDNAKAKRRMITGDLLPLSTGLCWEGSSGKVVDSEQPGQLNTLQDMRIGVLLPGFRGCTIDPYSTSYWEKEPVPAISVHAVPTTETATNATAGLMPPPRPPLQSRANTNAPLDQVPVGAAEGAKGPINRLATTKGSKPKPKAKALSKEDLEEFKDAVVGSQLSKFELSKGLKARYASDSITLIEI